MSSYNTGTISIVANSDIATGTNTKWKDNKFGVAPAQTILIKVGNAFKLSAIKNVNSDTELVLIDKFPDAVSNATYFIQTSVPDTYSDAARKVTAQLGYTDELLFNLNKWMTESGVVTVVTPEGKSIQLKSINALASDISNRLTKDQNGADIPNKSEFIKNLGLAETVERANNAVPKSGGTLTGPLSVPKISVDAQNKQRTTIISTNDTGESVIANYFNALVLKSGSVSYSNKDLAFQADTINTKPAVVVWKSTSSTIDNFDNVPSNSTYFGYIDSVKNAPPFPGTGIKFSGGFNGYDVMLHSTYYGAAGLCHRTRNGDNGQWSPWHTIWSTSNAQPDGNGFLKQSSPIIEIHPSGEFATNEESEGAEVTKESTGIYHISNVCGYNTDMGWGVHGGISVPKDNNNLELIFVDDRVQSDGSIIIETFHRQHAHLPTRFQNWRLKCIDANNERVSYKDG
ncbi:hypothetical protein [Photorhabdus temperata]|uniref:phage tail fiber protein n=1 Tax=Photorhabdus temperata TaxID=574560 RepID=UPI000389E585|nr:hypothetical protein [Photorhabdus temperata]EQB98025.1 hypothetical protein B738_27402 [Photorhabdus temperata subsp. temperata M1021]